MSDFVKPRHLIIDAIPYLKNIMGNGIVKDLQDDEEVCPVCHGTGLALSDDPYGLSDDPDRHNGEMFPYKHQSISFCQNCYNGVVKKCKYCGKLLNDRAYQCNCEGAKNARDKEWDERDCKVEQERFDKAKFIEPDDPIAKKLIMMYSDSYNSNEGYFFDWDEFFDYWNSDCEYSDDERPKYVWSTSEERLSLDADYLVSNACEDLCEDAADQISSKDIEELQHYLDKWADRQIGTNTYYVDYRYAIRIPWEDYDKEYKKNNAGSI